MLPPLPRCSGWASSSLVSPNRVSLPRFHVRIGLHIVLFEVCSAFTRVAACTLARSPYVVTAIQRLQTLRLLHACSGRFRRERSPGGACTHWKSAALSRRTWNADDDSNLTRMLTKGMLKNPDGSPMKKEDFRIVLKSELIINSPTALLTSLPPELKAAIRTAFLDAGTKDQAAFQRLSDGKNQPFQPVDNTAYDDTIRLIQFVDRLRKKSS